MTQMQKNAKTKKMLKTEREIFAFFVITFEPIEIQTHSEPQNNRLNFSFVKDIHVVDKKMARNGSKTDI